MSSLKNTRPAQNRTAICASPRMMPKRNRAQRICARRTGQDNSRWNTPEFFSSNSVVAEPLTANSRNMIA